MDDTVGDSLADKLRRLEWELAEAREAIASKDGELGDLRSQVDEAKAENRTSSTRHYRTIAVVGAAA